jgi:hypothetical protein
MSIMFFMNFNWQYKQYIIENNDDLLIGCEIDSTLLGHWSFNDDIAYLEIKKGKSLCCVIHNQVYVNVLIKKVNDSCYNVFYDSIEDVGSGGANLNWNNFSKTISIARLEVIDSEKARFYWLGFYDSINNVCVLSNSDFGTTVAMLIKSSVYE